LFAFHKLTLTKSFLSATAVCILAQIPHRPCPEGLLGMTVRQNYLDMVLVWGKLRPAEIQPSGGSRETGVVEADVRVHQFQYGRAPNVHGSRVEGDRRIIERSIERWLPRHRARDSLGAHLQQAWHRYAMLPVHRFEIDGYLFSGKRRLDETAQDGE
jgi:hypothetical protein